MAFYAELKRRKWFRVNGENWISWYSDKLYQDWYDSLTPEQLEKLRRLKKKKEEKAMRDVQSLLVHMSLINAAYLHE